MKDDNAFRYFFYAKERWGLKEAISRTWRFHLHPRNGIQNLKQAYKEWKLVDRREKKRWSQTVWAVDRDGDLYLVECPECHNTQSLYFHGKKDAAHCCGEVGGHFECYKCRICFAVYLEDGLDKIEDFREGVPPLPTHIVRNDNGTYIMGITQDAPWWWKRYQVYRDFDPETGKDGHGHKPYDVFFRHPEPPPLACEGDYNPAPAYGKADMAAANAADYVNASIRPEQVQPKEK